MKFLALALLLAVVPCTTATIVRVRGALLEYLDRVKESAQNALNNLDDTEYRQYRQYQQQLTQGLDHMHGYIKFASNGPTANAFAVQMGNIMDKITTDVDQLLVQLEPMHDELKATLEKHLEEYRAKLGTMIQDYVGMHMENMAALKAKVEDRVSANMEEAKSVMVPMVDGVRAQLNPWLEELSSARAELTAALAMHLAEYRAELEPVIQEYVAKHKDEIAALEARMEHMKYRVSVNVEETKSVMVPMVETVGSQLTTWLVELRTSLAPYAQEYKEQLFQAMGKVGKLREAVGPAAEEVTARLRALYENISAATRA